jgi:hypothetical protein
LPASAGAFVYFFLGGGCLLFFFYSFIHMFIHCLGHFSPLPPAPSLISLSCFVLCLLGGGGLYAWAMGAFLSSSDWSIQSPGEWLERFYLNRITLGRAKCFFSGSEKCHGKEQTGQGDRTNRNLTYIRCRYELNCVPPQKDRLKSQSIVPVNVTLVGNRVRCNQV